MTRRVTDAIEKGVRKKKSLGRKAVSSACYVTLHETNLALCMAAGFISGRSEKSAARDHHRSVDGSLITTGRPLSPEICDAARGGLDYGSVVAVELAEGISELGSTSPGFPGAMRVQGPVPLAYARRAIFRSTEEYENFMGKVSGYADMPIGALEFAVDNTLFPDIESPRGLFPSTTEVISLAKSGHDKLGGAMLAILHHGSIEGSNFNLELLQKALSGATGQGALSKICQAIANGLDKEATESTDLVLRAVIEAITSKSPGITFNPATFLDEVLSNFAKNPGGLEASMEKFVQHAKDIINARKEIGEDAFEDVAGKIVFRAILLFVLNPDPERLSALRKRAAKPGRSVHFLALAFSGALKGLTGMPGAWKSANIHAFLGIGVLVCKTLLGKQLTVSVDRSWDSNGNLNKALNCDGRLLLSQEIPAKAEVQVILSYAHTLEWVVSFDAGSAVIYLDVSYKGKSSRLSLRFLVSPTFPREPALEISVVFNDRLKKKEALQVVATTNDNSSSSAIFARSILAGKMQSVEVFSFIPLRLISQEALRDAAHAVVNADALLRDIVSQKVAAS